MASEERGLQVTRGSPARASTAPWQKPYALVTLGIFQHCIIITTIIIVTIIPTFSITATIAVLFSPELRVADL